MLRAGERGRNIVLGDFFGGSLERDQEAAAGSDVSPAVDNEVERSTALRAGLHLVHPFLSQFAATAQLEPDGSLTGGCCFW